ncbi:TerC family protein [Paenibacillus pini]|uniref:Membrane protein n=1 Tax=Paenibacillus pini JCM 16418 TaxID=1236976 RepID=W7YHJ3_9BACL|nr:TerC family protein [Paenibacillus pini]GAF07058.1 membrane protein [Paenibacillus pini JCM 16418]
METTVISFLLQLLNIVFLDIILGGDNAIVIGLAARKLPATMQKKAIIYGMSGAVVLRIIATILVVWLLNIPWLLLVGGVLLIGIAYKLLAENEDEHNDVKSGQTLWAAVRTIIIADAAMGIDNVIAIAGASQQNIILVIIGLLISVPIIVWGSTLFITLITRYPWIIYLGSAVLAYTASNMITEEKKLEPFFNEHLVLKIIFIAVIIIGVLSAGYYKKHLPQRKNKQAQD